MNIKYIENLKSCLTIDDVRSLMKGMIYEKSDNSKFEDDYISLPNPVKTFTKKDIRIKSELYELLFKVFLFLKLDDRAGAKLIGGGTLNYAADLKKFLLDMEKEAPNITHFGDIETCIIETISKNYIENTKVRYLTHGDKIRKLLDWIKYVNPILPSFLKIRPEIIIDAPNFHELRKKVFEQKREDDASPSRRKPYDLSELKKLVSYSINYIENYSEDGLFAGNVFIEGRRNCKTNTSRYKYLMERLKDPSLHLKEPILQELQAEVLSDSSLYIKNYFTSDGRVPRVRNISKRLINCSKKLEASCLVVILMTTGMRNSELVNLDRYPLIENDEYFHLKRMIFKTSKTSEGKEHSMPIPEITKKAIEVLSKIGESKDGKKEGIIMARSLQVSASNTTKADLSGAIGNLINFLCRYADVKIPPIVHQFRHAIAFLISRINQKDGYELARLFLGHKSLAMTLRYLGHYNLSIKDAMSELYEEDSAFIVTKMLDEVESGKKLYGNKGELITESYQFKGSYAEEFTELLHRNLLELIKKGNLAVIQTPVSFCMHDLTKPEEMACQRGFDLNNMIGENPIPSLCKGEYCGNAIFTETNIQSLMNEVREIPQDLKERLEKNKFFVENGGFEENPYARIVNKYKRDNSLIEKEKAV